MTPDKLDAFAKSAAEAREDLAKMRAMFTSRQFLRAASKKEMRGRLTQLFDAMDDLVNGAVGLATALADDVPAVDDEADLAI